MSDPLAWLDDALADLDGRGLKRTLGERAGPQRGDSIEINGQSLVNFGSNDYLGLANDPAIIAAARAALDHEGFGSGASPLVTGRSALHAELERKLAEFEGTEAALLFPTGYAANVGTIAALVGKGDAIYSDEANHASIIDGCRLSGAQVHIYGWPQGSQELATLLKKGSSFRRRLIVTDSVFSMSGGYASLPCLAELAEDCNAMLMVDEAHATGVLGERGRGLCEWLKVEDKVHIRIGTLSKALGGHGGFVVGSRKLIDWLCNKARPYFFSTAPSAAAAAAALAALDIIRLEPNRRHRLLELSQLLFSKLVQTGLSIGGINPIIPVFLQDADRTMKAAAELRKRGFFVPGIRPPSVPEGQSLLRISTTCRHTEEQIDGLVAAICKATR